MRLRLFFIFSLVMALPVAGQKVEPPSYDRNAEMGTPIDAQKILVLPQFKSFPSTSFSEVLRFAEAHAVREKIDLSDYYLSLSDWIPADVGGSCWSFTWFRVQHGNAPLRSVVIKVFMRKIEDPVLRSLGLFSTVPDRAILVNSKAQIESEDANRECGPQTIDAILRLGARVIDSSAQTFQLESGISLRALCYERRLAAIRVDVNSDYPNVDTPPEDLSDPDDQRPCCMTKSVFDRIVGEVETLGSFGRRRPDTELGVTGPSGWSSFYHEFDKVRIEAFGQSGGFALNHFTVFYWLPIAGRVQAKRVVRSRIFGAFLYTNRWLRVANRKFVVSPADYRRVRLGQTVMLQWNIQNSFARLVR